MLPFVVQFKSGQPVYEQVIFAVHKALVTGKLDVGDPFPSVRLLSKELKINPNTAHKVVAHLKREGVLVVQPGRGTFIGEKPVHSTKERESMLDENMEALVVQARKLGLTLEEMLKNVESKWQQLESD